MTDYDHEKYKDYSINLRERAGIAGRDRIACVVCGEMFISVCNHAYLKHGMSARDYKKLAGLPMTEGVITDEYRARKQAIATDLVNKDPSKMMRMRVAAPPGITRGKREPGLLWMSDVKTRSSAHLAEFSKQRRELWESRRVRFIELWTSNTKVADMCAEFGCNSRTIVTYRRKFGLTPRIVYVEGTPYRTSVEIPHVIPQGQVPLPSDPLP